MTISIRTELLNGTRDITRTKDGIAETLRYRVEGSRDPEEVIAAIGDLGFTIGGWHPVFGGIGILTAVNVTQDEAAGDYCLMEATFSPPQRSSRTFNDNNEVWEFDMLARQVHINGVTSQSKVLMYDGTLAEVGEGNRDTAIGRDGDRIQGASVYRPSGACRCVKLYDDLEGVDSTFRQTIYDLQGTVCNAAFIDWGERECLFLGANIRYPGNSTAEVTFNFQFGKKQENVEFSVFYPGAGGAIFDTVTVPEIYPFQIVGFAMGKRMDVNDRNIQVQGIEKVGIFTVYDEGDFSTLGLLGPDV